MATIDELYQQSLLGDLPTTLTPYQRIMGRMPLLQNPYANSSYGSLGGYSSNMAGNAAAPRALGQLGFSGGGTGVDQPLNQQIVDFFAKETENQRNDRMGKFNSIAQGVVNFAVPGMGLINALPSFLSSAALGRVNNALNPSGLVNYAPVEDAIPSYTQAYQAAQSYGGASMAEQQAMNDAIAAAADAAQGAAVGGDIGSISDQNTAGDGGGYGGYSDGGGSDSFGGGEYNMGGPVDRVGGPNPPGPDDGAGMLQLGEYVIKKSAVKKYGQGLLDMINDGKIPAKKMKSLLG